MTSAEAPPVFLEDLGIDLPEDFKPDYENLNSDETSKPSFDTDLAALDNPVESPATGDQPDPSKAGEAAKPGDTPAAEGAAATADPVFDERTPVADWQTKATANNWTDITTEQEFTDRLELSKFVQSNFFSDPSLKHAHILMQPVAESQQADHQKALLEYNVRSELKPFESEDDVEGYMSQYYDEDNNITPKGKRLAEYVQQQLAHKVNTTVEKLQAEGTEWVEQNKLYDAELKTAIKNLSSDLYSADDKAALHRYIKSGQYLRDTMLEDANGKPTIQGAAKAAKDLENAQFINPKFREITLKNLHADARKLGADDFVKKYFKS